MRKRKGKSLSNYQKLQNVLREVETMSSSCDYRDRKAILYIVKIYTDYINFKRNINLLQEEAVRDIFDHIFFDNSKYMIKMNRSYRIELGKFPIITNIWCKKRQIESLSHIGEAWIEDTANHFMKLILPIGVLVIYNGNHSANSGIIKSVGYIDISSEKSNIEVYDISDMYEEVYFDGENLIDIKNNKAISKVQFEYGCIFEIGRILHKYKVDLLDLYDKTNRRNEK